jgi:hypothetical protein
VNTNHPDIQAIRNNGEKYGFKITDAVEKFQLRRWK